ncbi:MAG: CHAT domain-containing protein [Bacteroidales bacterium]|nr:CHAT domain-containing protein [Bacteroidales bacterium]
MQEPGISLLFCSKINAAILKQWFYKTPLPCRSRPGSNSGSFTGQSGSYLWVLLLVIVFSGPAIAQDAREYFTLARAEMDSGNFIRAEKHLLAILKLKETIKVKNLVAVYNELGIINKSLGHYDKAIKYYQAGENLALKHIETLRYKLPSIYNNLGNCYKYKGDYKKALEYLFESIADQNIKEQKPQERNISLVNANTNIGIIYYLQNDYLRANEYFLKSLKITKKNHIGGLDEIYNNYANSLRALNDFDQADKYYRNCINICIQTSGDDYYKLAYVYKDYGTLKIKSGNHQEGLALYDKSLHTFYKKFGSKHPYTAGMLSVLGDYYLDQKNYLKALEFYQQALIANSKNFNSKDIYKNPAADNILSEIQQLQSLKKKATALSLLIPTQTDGIQKKRMVNLCVETLDLAVNTLKNLRQGYISLESRFYINKNEKAVYLLGIETALQLYELTGNKSMLEKAYQFSRAGKAAVLEDEIKRNETFTEVLPNSISKFKIGIQQNIAATEKLIYDEYEKQDPDLLKIKRWQSELFNQNKEYEKLLKSISVDFPGYSVLLSRDSMPGLAAIQEHLLPDETLVEYTYSLNNGHGQLYTFVIDNKELKYTRQAIDSTFEQKIMYCRLTENQANSAGIKLSDYNDYTFKLYQLYQQLIEPLHLARGKDIIIVADEKIAYLSFDVLISEFKEDSVINYGGLPYLLYDYRFSYAYSANMLLRQHLSKEYSDMVYAFAPDYHTNKASATRNQFGELKNAKQEINSIYKVFKGDTYIGISATKANFKKALKQGGIYHLAMHATPVKDNPEYSFLAFTDVADKKQSDYLYNYEIANLSMKASLLVLSACNSGDGEIYSGEGVMSLSRSFILAGIQSVVHALWKINDESSSIIMESFYRNLSEGKSKSEALQLAKIDYIEKTSPELAQPKYWAGLVLMGDIAPVKSVKPWIKVMIVVFSVLLVLSIGFYFRKKSRWTIFR